MAHSIATGVKNTVLTISPEHNDREVVIGFQRRPVQSPTILPWGIGVRVGTNRVVRIEGEDLFALRELLNELPEEAFVRPADPEPEVFTLVDGDGDVWGFREGYWACGSLIHSKSVTDFKGFDTWEEVERAYGIDDGIAPAWISGDVITYEGEMVKSVYTRGESTWTRVRLGNGVTSDITDDHIETLLAYKGYYQNYKVLRRGGKRA